MRAALERTDLTGRSGQPWHTLSGGERQRVHIARALAQESRELLLDEPTNHLDIHHQLDLLTLVTGLPVTTVVALHDLDLAAMYCDQVVVLCAGRVVAGGTPGDVLTQELIAEVYGVADVRPGGHEGRPHVCGSWGRRPERGAAQATGGGDRATVARKRRTCPRARVRPPTLTPCCASSTPEAMSRSTPPRPAGA